jgi:YD repeat-containing protein
MKSKSLTIPIVLFCLLLHSSYGQSGLGFNTNGSPTFKPPIPSPLGNNLVSSTGLYTGAASVSVPIYKMSIKNIELPVALNYIAGNGVRPDDFPGIVGNGWDIDLGGSITKLELATSSDRTDFTQHTYNGKSVEDPTAEPDYASNAKMEDYLGGVTVLRYGFKDRDIYSFDFCGLKGKFYTDPTGGIKVKSDLGEDLKITVGEWNNRTKGITILEDEQYKNGIFTYQYSSPLPDTMKILPYVYSFTITDSKGVKYIFGNTINAIEFTRPGMTPERDDEHGFNLIARKWYLTAIIAPNGEQVALQYKRGNFFITSQIQQNSTFNLFNSSNQYIGDPKIPAALTISSTLTNPCYLEQISTPKETLKVYWSKSNQQLGYDFKVPNPKNVAGMNHFNYPDSFRVTVNSVKELNYSTSNIYFSKYYDVRGASPHNKFPQKIDSIVVTDLSNVKFKKVQFEYSTSTATRLKLLKLKLIDNALQETETYQFDYNALSLPPYLSTRIDHFGYYNGGPGLPYFSSPSDYTDYFSDLTNRSDYFASRNPNIDYSRAEILEKITLPTKGYIKYTYEQNTYRKQTEDWPNTVSTNSTNQTSSGVRVKNIENYDLNNVLVKKKNYHYNIDYLNSGTSVSSGVLSWIPVYYEQYSGDVKDLLRSDSRNKYTYAGATYKKWSTNSVNPRYYYHGSHLTYSEVTEEETNGDNTANNGYTVYKFSNYDNGYLNKPVVNQIMDDKNVSSEWKSDEENSMDLERGKILEQTLYNSQKAIVSKTTNEYNDDPDRFDEHVKLLELFANPVYALNTPSLRYVAYLIYTYHPFLKSKTVVNYDALGNTLTEKYSYTYNQHRQLTATEFTNSFGEKTVTTTKYVSDFPAVTIHSEMLDKHTLAVVEQKQEKNDEVLTQTNFEYLKLFPSNQFLPKSVENRYKDYEIASKVSFNLYDGKGNILEVEKENEVKEIYLWGYNRQYPVAKIIGSDFNTVKSSVDTLLLNTGTETQIQQQLALLRNAFASEPHVRVLTYTYSPYGISSETDMNGNTLYYKYDKAGRLSFIVDKDANVLKRYCYNYSGQTIACETVTELYTNDKQTQAFFKSDCTGPITGAVNYTVPAGKYTSAVSKEQANKLAQKEIAAKGQKYADENGLCIPYVKITYENLYQSSQAYYGDVVVRFYADAEGTIPVAVNNYEVNLRDETDCIDDESLPKEWRITLQGDQTLYVTGESMMVFSGILGSVNSSDCDWVYIYEYCPECPPEEQYGRWIYQCNTIEPCTRVFLLYENVNYKIIP